MCATTNPDIGTTLLGVIGFVFVLALCVFLAYFFLGVALLRFDQWKARFLRNRQYRLVRKARNESRKVS